MVEFIYSPICEKLLLMRKAALKYGFQLREINLWQVGNIIPKDYPPYIQDAIKKIRRGEDGFYAWKVFKSGMDITADFEKIYSLDFYEYPDLSWKGDMPTIDYTKIQLKKLTIEMLEEGVYGPGAFCLSSLQNSYEETDIDILEIREKRKDFYREVVGQLGSFGLTIELAGLTLGFLLYLPKEMARRAGYYTAVANEKIQETLVICCLYIPGELRGEGLAVKLIEELQKQAPTLGYTRIEVAATHRFFDEEYTWWSKDRFMKAGFQHIEDRNFADGYPSMAIWGWQKGE